MISKPVTLWVVVAVAAILLWHAGRHRIAVFVVVTSLGGGIIDSLVKLAVEPHPSRRRSPGGLGVREELPSGHTMSATVVYRRAVGGVLAALTRGWRALGARATIFAGGIDRLVSHVARSPFPQ